MRMPRAERLRAMSSSRPRTLLIFTPGARVISYSVMVGPMVALMLVSCTPKLPSTVIMRSLLAFCSAMSMDGLASSYCLRRATSGLV